MAELIDLIIFMLRDEANQEIAIFNNHDGTWDVYAVNTSSHVSLGESEGKYSTEAPTLLEALNAMIITLERRAK
ncbi:hypothetical protein P106B_88 [Rhizobium phage vB_RglS_P106B]|uniref:Uncharacterized protein n=1 Tax=Rhizobium phage vB_RglS_P106B TaxID=1458697 RepID=W6EKK6_9CAUD|nr:hypothetical protein P106B_88 [Rhizobium phage vB_RglS_P106B]AHJ10771.1 hypothetical protein P106B_88 [Rhizobium phage vB_RglS_P106B]